MLQIIDISKSYGAKQVLEDISFSIPQGAIAGMIGPSGGGKSILLKIIGQVSRPDAGSILYLGEPLCERTSIGLMFQEGALFDSISVLDNVAFPLVHGQVPIASLTRKLRNQVFDKAYQILQRVGLADHMHKMPAQLSGGMRRRVSLARALVGKPQIVLLDDPTCGLDPVASSVIMNLIVELHQEYRPSLLMVSHDLRRLLPVVDFVFALYDKRIRFQGSLEDLKQNQCDFL
ncbi:MAG: ATP-binding cassette domain-containing protein, partial [Bdellovibrionales bacterium]|nr:ATP-binding cassette domain-containing protein [Bdellovibrionales bacterium]